MNRIDHTFQQLKQQDRTALVPFITTGFPHKNGTAELMAAMVEAGADLIELGMPFSDPMADGPVIQRASEKALESGVGLDDVLQAVRDFRAAGSQTPVILMGYLNPVERRGWSEFAAEASQAGVDGLLMVDLPPEEADSVKPLLVENDLYQIFLVSPTTRTDRIKLICQHAGGFVYYVSLKGVTGADHLAVGSVEDALSEIRAHTDLPVGVGFGIKNAEDAVRVGTHSDAVVIGSALVKHLEQAEDTAHAATLAKEFLNPIRAALDGLSSCERKVS